jgi:hypothetical protein
MAVSLGACSAGAAATPVPTPVPTPVVTPDPHLAEPASADDVYRKLTAAGLRITPNSASSATGHEPVKRINATFEGWPLILSEFSSAGALAKAVRIDPKAEPRRGEPPFTIVGLNIAVEFGPKAVSRPKPDLPDERRRAAALALAQALDPLLGPLAVRAVEPLSVSGGAVAASGAVPASTGSAVPVVSAAP